MFGFVKQAVLRLSNVGELLAKKCVFMSNQLRQPRSTIFDTNSNEPLYYPFSVNKCSGSCNDIDNPYAQFCVPDAVKNINVKVFNLMSRINETSFLFWHDLCECKCILNGDICNSKQRWNNDKCRCECVKLSNYCSYNDGFIWNPCTCNCECNKSRGVEI